MTAKGYHHSIGIRIRQPPPSDAPFRSRDRLVKQSRAAEGPGAAIASETRRRSSQDTGRAFLRRAAAVEVADADDKDRRRPAEVPSVAACL